MTAYPSGIKFPFRFNDSGSTFSAEGDEKLASNIMALIYSPVNSRLIRKAVGTVSYQKVFRNLQAVGFAPLEELVRETVSEFEPRIKILGVVITTEDRDKTRVLVIKLSFTRKSSVEINSLQIEVPV